jgi:CheY-like chemotaxis protein
MTTPFAGTRKDTDRITAPNLRLMYPQTSAEQLPASRGVVLHVEDDDEVRFATRAVLSVAGFEVRGAATPECALEMASIYTDLDVLLVDYHLNAASTGTEVAEAIARRLGHAVPTVILTGDPFNAEVPWLDNSPVWLARKPMCPATLVAGLLPLVAFRRAMQGVARS